MKIDGCSMTMEQLTIQFLGLPAKAGAILAEKLIASLEEERAAGDVDALWAEVEDAAVSLRPAEVRS